MKLFVGIGLMDRTLMRLDFWKFRKKCKDCGKYHFSYIKDWNQCDQFIAKYPNKKWSDTCKPVLN